MKKIDKKSLKLILCFFVYIIIMMIVELFYKDHFFFPILTWNVFLAVLPLVFYIMFKFFAGKKRKIGMIISFILWILFFPNSPYVLTDTIHLERITYYSRLLFSSNSGYSTNVFDWFMLIILGIGIFLSLIAGLYTLYKMHKHVLKKSNKLVGWTFISIVSLLSGYAIYIGRVLRVNSWDVLNPLDLISNLIKNINAYSLKFTLTFAFYILFVYVVYYVAVSDKSKKLKEE